MRLGLRVLWTQLLERDRPVGFSELPQAPCPLLTQMGLPPNGATLHAFSTGAKIFEAWEVLRAKLHQEVLLISEMLGTAAQWARHEAALRSLVEQFYKPGKAEPAFLWGHRLCWTDRCIVKNFSERGFFSDLRRSQNHLDYLWSDRVRFTFDPMSPSDDYRWLYLTPSEFLWHAPDGMDPRRVGFVRTRERRTVVLADGYSSSFREQLGVGNSESADSQPYLKLGLHPGLDDLVYALLREPASGRPLLTPTRVNGEGVSLSRPRLLTGAVVDQTGIYDVVIVKLWRLWWRSFRYKRGGRPYVDELTFAHHRRTGRLVYIAASRDRFGHLESAEEGTGWLWPWLKREFGIEP